MNAYCLGRTQQGAQVIDILNSIEDEQERSFVLAPGIVKNLLDTGIFTRFDNRQATLMHSSLAKLIETLAWNHFNRNASSLRLLQKSSEIRRLTLSLGQQDTLDLAR